MHQIPLTLLAIAACLYYGSSFLIPLVFGIFFGGILRYGVISFTKQNIPKKVALIVMISIFVACMGCIGWGIYEGGNYITEHRQQIVSIYTDGVANLNSRLPDIMPNIQETLRGGVDTGILKAGLDGTMSLMTHILLISVYSILMVSYRENIGKLLSSYGFQGKQIMKTISDTMARYIMSLIQLAGVIAVLYMIVFGLFKIPQRLEISLGAAILTLIPTVGTFIGIVLSSIYSAAATGSIQTGFFIFFILGCIQTLEEYIILPYIVGKTVSLNSLVIITSIVAGGLIWGVAGVFLSVPIVSVIQKLGQIHEKKWSTFLC